MLAIRPPEYFPGLEYAALLLQAGAVVLADTFQYSRQSFQNRARLRTPDGWQWISVPLERGQHGAAIAGTRLREGTGWQRTHWKALVFNYGAAPFFDAYAPRLRPLFEQPWTLLGALTCATVAAVHALLEAPSRLVRASALDGAPADLPKVLAAAGGGPLLVPEAVAAVDAGHAAEAYALRCVPPVYRQAFAGFEPGMSALDLLFNYGPEARRILDERTVVAACERDR
ncbi:MAG: WbqC family protein [Rhodothermales bacterium]|nr:WbqC family protein [Rhodothermales bacterium]